MIIDLNDKKLNLLGNLLNQLPISSTWIASEISEIINSSEVKEVPVSTPNKKENV
jgi:hypothetical protein